MRVAICAGVFAVAYAADIFDAGYCDVGGDMSPEAQMINTNNLDCPRLMEFLYLAADRVHAELVQLQKNFTESQTTCPSDGCVNQTWRIDPVSKGSSLMSAHFHISGALTVQRRECMSEDVRMLYVVLIRRAKKLLDFQLRQQWNVYGDGEVEGIGKSWIDEAVEIFAATVATFRAVMKDWKAPDPREAQYFSDEADGTFTTLELLRRDTFAEWMVDKGLLRALLKNLFEADSTVADFGAGSGTYATWLNETGLVTAWAFDGTMDVAQVTSGNVTYFNLAEPVPLGRTFDYALCLEVAERIPPEHTATFLSHLDRATTKAVVLSWSPPPQVGQVNGRTEAEVIDLFAKHAPSLQVDQAMTNRLRPSVHLPYLARTLLVLRKT
jgi:hypothetical protein